MTMTIRSLAGLTALALTFALPGRARAQETKVSGLFFGDYFAAVSHHDGDVQDANGFWARRVYLTFDRKIDSSWDVRLRFEAHSPGDFTSKSKMDPFLKDLWIRWKNGRHSIVMGVSPSPSWDVPEHVWGYRDLEKTPMDLFKMGSSRDFGIAFKGAFGEGGKVQYHMMLANGAGEKAETDQGKKYMGALIFHPVRSVTLHVYADHEDRKGSADRSSYELFGAVQGVRGRVGAMWARQDRNQPDAADLSIDVVYGFAVLNAARKVNLVVRVDRLLDPLPDAAGISYFKMDPSSKATFFVGGLDIELNRNVRLIPNVEFVTYDAAGIDTDVFLKTTVSVKF